MLLPPPQLSWRRFLVSAEDVRLKLGEPMSVTQSTSEVVWTYQHWQGKPAMLGTGYSKSETTLLTVRFQKGKVVDYSLSTADR